MNLLDAVQIKFLFLPHQKKLVLESLCKLRLIFHQDIKLGLLAHLFAHFSPYLLVSLNFSLFL
jgi:hypothetical protein